MLSIKLFNATPTDGEIMTPCLLADYGALLLDGSKQEEVLEHLRAHRLTSDQMNKTSFFRSWIKAEGVGYGERLLHQLAHYLSTYGQGMWDDPYLPVDQFVTEAPQDARIYVISAMPRKEMIGRCLEALKRKTDTTDYVRLLIELGYEFTGEEEVGSLESEALIADQTGKMPREIIRYLIYKATGNTLKIKSEKVLDEIEESRYEVPPLSEADIQRAAESFLRDKALWLAFKRANRKNAPVVNKIRRLATRHHRPFVEPIIRRLTSTTLSKEELAEIARGAKTGDLARAINAIRIYASTDARVYRIRNGKTHAGNGKPPVSLEYLDILMDELRSRICSHTAPEGVHLAVPVSAKKFVGDLPEGTAIDMPEGSIIGIYWKGSGIDLDLSCTMLDGEHFGWNSLWSDAKVIYSGDITSAPNGATEWLWFRQNATAMIRVNGYLCPEDQEFYLVIARYHGNKLSRGYIVDPNDVLFEMPIKMTQRQMTLGLVHQGKFFVKSEGSGIGRVATPDPTRIKYLIAEAENTLRLDDISIRENGPLCRDQLIKLIS